MNQIWNNIKNLHFTEKERNKKKNAEKQIENERFLTENSQRINKNYR